MTKTQKHIADQIEMRIQENLVLSQIVDAFEMSLYWQRLLTKTIINIVEQEIEIHDENTQAPRKDR